MYMGGGGSSSRGGHRRRSPSVDREEAVLILDQARLFVSLCLSAHAHVCARVLMAACVSVYVCVSMTRTEKHPISPC